MTRPSDDMTAPFLKNRSAPVGPMFDAFRAARAIKMPRWAVPLLVAATLFHGVLFLTMWVRSIWDVEQLEKSKGGLADLAIAPAPPPPPAPPPGAIKPMVQELKPIKRVVRDLVQLRHEDKPQEVIADHPPTEVECDPAVEKCDEGPGVKDGQIGAPPAPPTPVPPPPPAPVVKLVPPTMLEGQRIAGDKMIIPDETTKRAIMLDGKDKLVGSFKLCLTVDGMVASVTMMRSTGFAAYDAKIQREMHAWRYRPYMVNDKAIPVCTAITFLYSQAH